MLVTLGPGAMISDLNRLCYHHYIYVLDPILQVIESASYRLEGGWIGDFYVFFTEEFQGEEIP